MYVIRTLYQTISDKSHLFSLQTLEAETDNIAQLERDVDTALSELEQEEQMLKRLREMEKVSSLVTLRNRNNSRD